MSSNTVHQSTIDRNIGNCTIEMLSQTRELLDNASMQPLCGSAVNGNPGVNRIMHLDNSNSKGRYV